MSSHAPYNVSAVVATAAVLGGAYYVYRTYMKSEKTKLPSPEEWKEVGKLKDIYVYPIKSCAPVTLDRAECSYLGLKDGWLRDRVLMIVDKKDNFITARAYPELLTVHPSVKSAVLTLKHSDMETIHINLAEVMRSEEIKTVTVWSTSVPVYDCGGEVKEWLSRLISRSHDSYRLVFYASQNCRKMVPLLHKVFNFTKNDTGALTDETSFNLINEASVDDLNTRLKNCQVSPRNFRPNFVLKGAQPYDEDKWRFVKIGENIFEILKPCTRCTLTTIDPETGVRDPNREPLETLKSYRQIENPVLRKVTGNSPRMGLQMALRSGPGGFVSLNDTIYAA